jgi:transcriptional regulator with GAF, ATPase, and Fis domain
VAFSTGALGVGKMMKDETQIEVPQSIKENWQEVVNILSEILGVPAALIMRVDDPEIEVFVSSKSEGNPYRAGDKEHFRNSGLYCETVIKKKDKLLVPNALADVNWKDNPDVKLNMISYLGFPIHLSDGKLFGTICVLDDKENPYSETFEKLILKLRDLVQSDLEVIFINQVLGDKNKRSIDYLMELQALQGVVPICSNCKSIKDNQSNWHPVEHYLIQRPEADFTHSICPKCMKKLYPEYDESS